MKKEIHPRKEKPLTGAERDAIQELGYEEPSKKMLMEMKENLDNGSIRLIIGEGASARTIGILLNKVIGGIHKNKGHKKLETIFLPSSKYQKDETYFDEKFNNAFKRTKFNKKNDRILIVTDSINKGDSIDLLVKTAKKNGINFDIFTLGIPVGEIDITGRYRDGDLEKKIQSIRERFELDPDSKIIFNRVGTPEIYLKKYLSGVVQKGPGIISLKSKLKDGESRIWNLWKRYRRGKIKMRATREEIGKIANNLIDWYKDIDK